MRELGSFGRAPGRGANDGRSAKVGKTRNEERLPQSFARL
jgi:hypothetical protein